MDKIGYLFSGQGDQFPGMGQELCQISPAAKEVFALCDSLRPGTSQQCFSGTEQELRQTQNTQPCLFAVELAAFRALEEAGAPQPDGVAGFSLGEVAAATASGLVPLETGFRLVCRRGQLMQEAAGKVPTAMVAVLRLNPDQVKTLCSRFSQVYPVNFNCPGQIAVSGLASQMPEFQAAVKEAGGRTVPLAVQGGFHSPFMAEAARTFARDLEKLSFQTPRMALYANATAREYTPQTAADLLSRQIAAPVLWEDTVRAMVTRGMNTFVELGPGRTLTNMVKKIVPAARALTAAEYLQEVAG
jgi:[acyl-carrier-protein] S-malonyltransferase